MTGERGGSHPGGRVLVVGDDGLGVRVLQELRELGIAVTAVCLRPEAPFARAAQTAQVPLVVGDPENEDTLREAGVGEASVCGLLGDADLTNLHVALELQELAPRARIVMRLFNTSLTGAVRADGRERHQRPAGRTRALEYGPVEAKLADRFGLP